MIESFVKFIKYLQKVTAAVIAEDTWATFTLQGKVKDLNLDELKQFADVLEELHAANLFSFDIEGGERNLSIDNLKPYVNAAFADKNWTAVFSKHNFISLQAVSERRLNFFMTVQGCLNWLNTVNIFDQHSPVYTDPGLLVFVGDLAEPIGNDLLGFCPFDHSMVSRLISAGAQLPDHEKLKEAIHFVTKAHFHLDPRRFQLGPVNESQISALMIRYSCMAMSCCLADEFYTPQKIIVNGSRRVLFNQVRASSDTFTYEDYDRIRQSVSWIYEDKITVRKKLFNERFALDADDQFSLAVNLKTCAKVALEQAQERYIFVITDRKDAYVKELKDLLKDLRAQSDLYAGKIRTLLSNFLRDALASLVLVGFSIFTKFSENLTLDKHQLLTYVFWGLGIYFLFSIVMQIIHDLTDIAVTSKELKYWKSVSKELIPDATFETHFKKSLKGRRRSLYFIYPFIVALYLAVVFCCFKYPAFFEKLISKEPQKQEQNLQVQPQKNRPLVSPKISVTKESLLNK